MSNYIEQRPWGKFEIISDTDTSKVKLITVNPGQQLSYQYHHKRSEDWLVISGVASILIDEAIIIGQAGQKYHIPALAKHRLGNHGTEPLVILEIQTGTYFGEDDIVRL